MIVQGKPQEPAKKADAPKPSVASAKQQAPAKASNFLLDHSGTADFLQECACIADLHKQHVLPYIMLAISILHCTLALHRSIGFKGHCNHPQHFEAITDSSSAGAQKGRGKPKGPLPMTLVQLLLLAAFGGIGYAATAQAEATAKALQAAADALEAGYNAIEARVAKFAGKPSEMVTASPQGPRQPSGKDATDV